MMNKDIIAAIATAVGKGGIGIIRVSGPNLLDFAHHLLGEQFVHHIKPRHALLSTFYSSTKEAIDEGILLYFPAPHSFTGEDVLEIQGHGGMVVLNMLLQRCLELGARVAEAGEFSKRAFLNGKMDLSQAEGIADLIDAHSETAARSAMRSLQGTFGALINNFQKELTNLRMLIEACIDFPEEEIDVIEHYSIKTRLQDLLLRLDKVQQQTKQGSILRDGARLVLVGAPNVGKSSLMNALSGRDVSIVTDIAGTTRDTLREHILLDDVPVYLIDTAGLRDTEDQVEKIGIERTWQAIEQADIILILQEGNITNTKNTHEAILLSRLPVNIPRIFVYNKSDLYPEVLQDVADGVWVSAKTGYGLAMLKQKILDTIGYQGHHAEGVFLARTRHLDAIIRSRSYIEACTILLEDDHQHTELIAEELRLAQQALGEITGSFSSDDLLGVIFSSFCIGK
jgi:tRNA modification GTPase